MAYDAFMSYSHSADGRLAPALQRGLQRLAKPWHRLRAHASVSRRDDAGDEPAFVVGDPGRARRLVVVRPVGLPDAAASEWVGARARVLAGEQAGRSHLARRHRRHMEMGQVHCHARRRRGSGRAPRCVRGRAPAPRPVLGPYRDRPRPAQQPLPVGVARISRRRSGVWPRTTSKAKTSGCTAAPNGSPGGQSARSCSSSSSASLFGVVALVQRNRADHDALVRGRRPARSPGPNRRRRPARPVAAPRGAEPPSRAIERDRRRARGGARPRATRVRVLGADPGRRAGVVAASRDGRLLAVPGSEGVVSLVDGATGAPFVRSAVFPRGHSGLAGASRSAPTAPECWRAVDGTVMVWNVRYRRRPSAALSRPPAGRPRRAHCDGPVLAMFDPADSSRLFTAANDRGAGRRTRPTARSCTGIFATRAIPA